MCIYPTNNMVIHIKDRQLLIERLLRCWPLLYSYTCNIHILYIK